jgi:type IV secretory pathway protease TraF
MSNLKFEHLAITEAEFNNCLATGDFQKLDEAFVALGKNWTNQGSSAAVGVVYKVYTATPPQHKQAMLTCLRKFAKAEEQSRGFQEIAMNMMMRYQFHDHFDMRQFCEDINGQPQRPVHNRY